MIVSSWYDVLYFRHRGATFICVWAIHTSKLSISDQRHEIKSMVVNAKLEL